jgi:hypothetical protein
MSEVRQIGKLIGEDGSDVPFFLGQNKFCSIGRGCVHYGGSYCTISDLMRKHGMDCGVYLDRPNFYQERPELSQAEQVEAWLEAGEYVVEVHPDTHDAKTITGLHFGKQYMCEDGGWTYDDPMWIGNETLLHHGDVVSTITYLCEQGYEVEFEYHGQKRIAVPGNVHLSPNVLDKHRKHIGYANITYAGCTITRFCRPEPAETDAQKIERLLREGFVVETRTSRSTVYMHKLIGNLFRCENLRTGFVVSSDFVNLNHDETYLSHYREPEPEEVMRKMDEILTSHALDVFGPIHSVVAQGLWDRLSDYYAIARWQLITENPENNLGD